jgi:mono/diheme cytochrome c family protein
VRGYFRKNHNRFRQAFYTANNCATCHCADAAGGCVGYAPSIVGEEVDELFSILSGAEGHPGGTVAGVTQVDADDLAAWLATQ